MLPLLTFWTLYITRIIIETADPTFVGDVSASDYLISSVGICVVPMLALLCRPAPATTDLALRWALIALFAFLVGGLGLGRSTNSELVETGRLSLAVLNPISVGHAGASGIIVATCWLAFDKRTSGSRRVLIAVPAVILALLTMLLTGSRGPLVALAFAGLYLAFVVFRHNRLFQWFFVAAIAGLTVIAIGSLATAWSQLIGVDSDQVITVGSRTIEEMRVKESYVRWLLLVSSFNVFLERPLLGGAIVDPVTRMSPHNLFLESLMSTGIVGGACFLMFVAATIRAWFKIFLSRPEVAWIALLSIQYTVGGLFSGAIWSSSGFWTFAAAAIAVAPAGRVPRPFAR
jgi:O-antigen ligase